MQLSKFRIPPFSRNGHAIARELSGICTTDDFCRSIERERDRSDRFGLKFAVVSFDVKTAGFNGACLKKFANAVHTRIRVADEIGLIDDQHIGLLLFNTEKDGAIRFVKDLQESLENIIIIPHHNIFIYPNDFQIFLKYFQNVAFSSKEDRRNFDEDAKKHMQFDPVNLNVFDRTSYSGFSDEAMDLLQDIGSIFLRKIPVWKRLLDITGASMSLVVFSPFFLIIPLMIKILSPGPVFFRQERVGFCGQKFTFLKFRSMEVNFDPTVHCQYCSDLINCDGEAEKPMVKLDDCNSQIIPFFKFIRKTYLDELPQLINVLRGEMSLVGPRPPIPYEVAEYSRWHNNRFDIVPGMTGLWQISGKNRLTFKEMVRLDISYCRKLSFIMDLKILLNTPLAIVSELFSPDKQMYSKRG